MKISDNSWKTVVNCAQKWINLDGERQELAELYKDVFQGSKDDAAKMYCFHTKCYSKFTYKGHIERAVKRKRKLEESAQPVGKSAPCTPSPKKRLRSHCPTALLKSGGSRVLPKVCIVCKKKAGCLKDIIVLQSKGRKHTLKSLSLGLTLRHITGSKKVIDLLNGFGHSSSHKTIVRYDTSLAQMQLNKGPVFVPDSFSEKLNTVLVWDNIDFSEETTSGHGTTHHTNGIAIQCSSDMVTEALERQTLPRIPRPFSKAATHIVPYQPKRREGTPPFDIRKDVFEKSFYISYHYIQHLKDLAFVIMRYTGDTDSNLPGWTGFNTKCFPTESLVKTNIAYLPMIEASPKEMNTVDTILCRSSEMADK
ncbi:hypothetical protein LOTGIDRAFT_163777 [Lottia gigantea]|uniref:Uncharacterized protein n=1 Tax=Lottia gigantea TaxID=225164 RepID=V4A7B7_LOTGI|nr:hypothetical protein LOTGIDRAFT_163777 [Lottia gigantea]ESO90890.1 hypothetical protein LOTGIDRAFT_163777 [Lottia gigantea]